MEAKKLSSVVLYAFQLRGERVILLKQKSPRTSKGAAEGILKRFTAPLTTAAAAASPMKLGTQDAVSQK